MTSILLFPSASAVEHWQLIGSEEICIMCGLKLTVNNKRFNANGQFKIYGNQTVNKQRLKEQKSVSVPIFQLQLNVSLAHILFKTSQSAVYLWIGLIITRCDISILKRALKWKMTSLSLLWQPLLESSTVFLFSAGTDLLIEAVCLQARSEGWGGLYIRSVMLLTLLSPLQHRHAKAWMPAQPYCVWMYWRGENRQVWEVSGGVWMWGRVRLVGSFCHVLVGGEHGGPAGCLWLQRGPLWVSGLAQTLPHCYSWDPRAKKDRAHKRAATHRRRQTHACRFGLQAKDGMWCRRAQLCSLAPGLIRVVGVVQHFLKSRFTQA